ncbi:hypothetical protein AAHA92_18744 [Salvia divinorum]|uniref:Uncharacterized protein n=1 Tax=Salvia divinorum TaxID=28513 RepID=A0ABD1H330_SALDI
MGGEQLLSGARVSIPLLKPSIASASQLRRGWISESTHLLHRVESQRQASVCLARYCPVWLLRRIRKRGTYSYGYTRRIGGEGTTNQPPVAAQISPAAETLFSTLVFEVHVHSTLMLLSC